MANRGKTLERKKPRRAAALWCRCKSFSQSDGFLRGIKPWRWPRLFDGLLRHWNDSMCWLMRRYHYSSELMPFRSLSMPSSGFVYAVDNIICRHHWSLFPMGILYRWIRPSGKGLREEGMERPVVYNPLQHSFQKSFGMEKIRSLVYWISSILPFPTRWSKSFNNEFRLVAENDTDHCERLSKSKKTTEIQSFGRELQVVFRFVTKSNFRIRPNRDLPSEGDVSSETMTFLIRLW